MQSRLAEDDPLRRSDAEAYARTMAGEIHEIYGYQAWLADQLMADKAESEYLERHADIWGISRKAATKATGTATLTGQDGAAIPSGTVLAAWDRVRYLTTASAAISGTTAVVSIEAETAGDAGNRDAGQTLTLVSPVAGVQNSAVASALAGGGDTEGDDDLRARLLARIRNPPQGGALRDYEAWALEVPGVTRVWPVANGLGAGTVVVRFVRDGDASIIPDGGEVAAIQAYIDERRPVTAAVTVAAPTAQPVEVTVSGPSSPSARAAIVDAVKAVFRYGVAPGAALSWESLEEAVEEGGAGFVLEDPVADVAATSAGHLHTYGGVTWA